jgi:membrane protein DedA with SNARE-associated domain
VKEKKMVKRKFLIIALLLAVIITGAAVAASVSGVEYWFENDRTYFVNTNGYLVGVTAEYWDGRLAGTFNLDSGEEKSFSGELKVRQAARIRIPNPTW